MSSAAVVIDSLRVNAFWLKKVPYLQVNCTLLKNVSAFDLHYATFTLMIYRDSEGTYQLVHLCSLIRAIVSTYRII